MIADWPFEVSFILGGLVQYTSLDYPQNGVSSNPSPDVL